MKFEDKSKHLKKLQDTELKILKYFDKICKKNNLKYYLASGTLLGAVRHKGFIPWDDDIDVFMPGEDYLKLYDVMAKNPDKNYFFQSLDTEKNYFLLWNKIRLNNTVFVEKGWEKNEINKGIFIDIFPLLEVPLNKNKEKILNIKLKIIHLLIEANLKNDGRSKYYGKLGYIMYKIIKLIPQKVRNKMVIKNLKKMCLYKSNSPYYFTTDTGIEEKITKSSFDETIDLMFENSKFSCPKGYDKYLTETYGDYMKLPEESKRNGHGEVYLEFGNKNNREV